MSSQPNDDKQSSDALAAEPPPPTPVRLEYERHAPESAHPGRSVSMMLVEAIACFLLATALTVSGFLTSTGAGVLLAAVAIPLLLVCAIDIVQIIRR